MATSLVLLLLLAAATAAIVRQLNANHHQVTAWPIGDDVVADRDVARVRHDLAAARSTSAPGEVRARSVQGATAGRRIAPPATRAA